jgi:predicted dehydrogenase
MDIMTTRHAILTRLIHQVVHTPEVFGEFDSQDTTEPAITIASVHHLYKTVNGQPLQRPAWYYDTTIQGDGLVDIQSHMIEQVQWWVLGDDLCDFAHDVSVDSARRWSTPVPLALFTASTGLSVFPDTLLPAVHNGELAYACNGELRYRLRGVSVRQTAEWRQHEPDGGSDFHHMQLRGTRCNIHVRQGPDTNYKAEVHLEPIGQSNMEPRLRTAIAAWQQRFPGLSCTPSDIGWQLITPPPLDHGHESHFALVLQEFLTHLDRGSWPDALRARIHTRYALIARALELASNI